jgi:ketosteroid isomerase-like protein
VRYSDTRSVFCSSRGFIFMLCCQPILERTPMTEECWGFAYVRYSICLVAGVLGFALAAGVSGEQRQQKPAAADRSEQMPAASSPVADEIDHDIGEMLGAFQVGNVEAMHKYYADNVTFVSSAYEPPVVGWQNYAAVYERERAAFQGMQLIRRNTFIFNHGDVAWASYQWDFESALNGKPFSVLGQTTLILAKLGENWLIVHNHTSEIRPAGKPAQAQPRPQAPAQDSP